MFDLGLLDLESKAKIETVYWQIAQSIVDLFAKLRYVPDEVKELEIVAQRPVRLQFLSVPVAARSLGGGAAFPGDADPPS